MNHQQVKTPNSNQRPMPAHIGRKRPDPQLLGLLRAGMLILSGLIVLLGLVLIVLPSFHVQSIEVEGNSIHSAEEIINASGIEVGQEVFSVSKNEVNHGIWSKCKYVDEIAVVRSFNKIKIIVVERQNVMVTSFNGKYFSFDQSFQVIEESPSPERMASFLKVELPLVKSLAVGGGMTFENGETDLSYIGELIGELKAAGLLSRISEIDFSKKYSVSYILDHACRVELGGVSEIGAKLKMTEQILSLKGWASDVPAVVDVSNLKKPTYRVLSSAEVLMDE